jgi:hypothetical protein
VPYTYRHARAPLSTMQDLTDVPINFMRLTDCVSWKRPDQGVPPIAPCPCRMRLTAIFLPVQPLGLDPIVRIILNCLQSLGSAIRRGTRGSSYQEEESKRRQSFTLDHRPYSIYFSNAAIYNRKQNESRRGKEKQSYDIPNRD